MKKLILLSIILVCLFLVWCWNSKQEEQDRIFQKKAECSSLTGSCPAMWPNSDSCSNGTFYSTYYNSCICEMYCSNSEHKVEYMLYDIFSNSYIVDCYGYLLIKPEFVNVFDTKLKKKVKYTEDEICHDVLEHFMDYIK